MKPIKTLFAACLLTLFAACDPSEQTMPNERPAPSVEAIQQSHQSAPTPPPYFYDCAGDTNVYSNELVIFTGGLGTGHCAYTWKAPGSGPVYVPYLNDYDGTYRILSYKSRIGTGGQFYDSTAGGSASAPFYNPQDNAYFNPGWQPSAIYIF